MTAHPVFLVTSVLLQVLHASAGNALVTSGSISPDYVIGTTPTSLSITASFQSGIDTSGDTITIQFDEPVFVPASNPAVSTTGGLGPVFAPWTVGDAFGRQLVGSLLLGSITSTSVTFTITSDLAQIGTLGAGGLSSTSFLQTALVYATSANTGGDISAISGNWFFYPIPAPTVTLTTLNLNAGTLPTSFQVVVKTPIPLASSDIIEITMSEAVFTGGVFTGLVVTGATFSSYTTNSGGTKLTATLSAIVSADTTIDMTLGSAMMTPLPSTPGPVTFDLSMASETIVFNNNGFGTILAAASTGNDPVARFGDVQREFQLPPGVITTLVEAPDVTILGSVFEGGGPWEQWFDRIVLTVPWQDRSLEIKIRPNLHSMNFSRSQGSHSKTLDITVGYARYGSNRAVTKVAGYGEVVPWEFLGHQVVFRRVMRNHNQPYTTIGKLPRECVDVAGEWLHFYICSAPASEYFGRQRDLSMKYAHLDLVFVEVKDYKALSGLLPELWGVQPMSESTRACVKDDTSQTSKPTIASNGTATAWAGGPGMESFLNNSFEQKQTETSVVV